MISMFTENKMKSSKKEHLPYSQTWRRFSDVLGLLCCLWHWVPWMCAWHHENQEITKAFWSGMLTPVSESWVSVEGHGSCSRKTTSNTSKSTQEWFKTTHWTVLKWSAMRPDLNPIEHMWGDLKTTVGRRHPSNLGELEQFAQEEWDKLPVERWRKLIHGYRKCLTAVILSKGCDTKY